MIIKINFVKPTENTMSHVPLGSQLLVPGYQNDDGQSYNFSKKY